MTESFSKTYVLGLGAVGLPLAAFLAREGREVVGVRTSATTASTERVDATIRDGLGSTMTVPLEVTTLPALAEIDGLVVITAKSYANPAIAEVLRAKRAMGPLVILQNGVGVEDPFLRAGFSDVYRCILYVTGQSVSPHEVTFRPIASCPIGTVAAQSTELVRCVATLNTPHLAFHAEPNIRREVWKKVIINAVFNSICPLLDVDNGVFTRDDAVAALARDVVRECLVLAHAEGASLTESEVMDQIFRVSRGSNGVLISTLQDIRSGRPTEIETLNLAMARLAAARTPKIDLTKTELLGKLVLAKSKR
jgi:2-dehydropantoate 2-reductase